MPVSLPDTCNYVWYTEGDWGATATTTLTTITMDCCNLDIICVSFVFFLKNITVFELSYPTREYSVTIINDLQMQTFTNHDLNSYRLDQKMKSADFMW